MAETKETRKMKGLYWKIGIPIALAIASGLTGLIANIQPENKKLKQESAFSKYENLHYNTRLMEDIEIYEKNGKQYLNIIGRKGYPQEVLQDMR